jgi:hypothetical protein
LPHCDRRRDFVARLNLVNRLVVGGTVGLGAADDPNIRRRRLDARHALRDGAGPATGGHEKIGGFGSGGAPARRGEHIGPHVEHRQKVVAPIGVGRRDHHRLFGEIKPAARIEGVEIRPHHHAHVGGRKRANIGKAIHWATDRRRSRLLVGELPACHVHGDDRIEIEISVDTERVSLLLAERSGVGSCHHGSKKNPQRKAGNATHNVLPEFIARPDWVIRYGNA